MSLVHESNLTAVILAGGRGSRLGGFDKGLIEYQGKQLIEHVLTRIKPQIESIYINANRNHDEYQNFGYPVFNDEMSNFQGPLAGILAAMHSVSTDYIVTMPCDGPCLPFDLVERLMKKMEGPNDITVAHDGQRIQPMYALIPTKLAENLIDFLENGNRKVSLWFSQHNVKQTDFSDQADAFFNINTEQQRVQGLDHD